MAVLITSEKVCEILNINRNHLYQLQYRKQVTWVEKKGKQVFYDLEQIQALKEKRDARHK